MLPAVRAPTAQSAEDDLTPGHPQRAFFVHDTDSAKMARFRASEYMTSWLGATLTEISWGGEWARIADNQGTSV